MARNATPAESSQPTGAAPGIDARDGGEEFRPAEREGEQMEELKKIFRQGDADKLSDALTYIDTFFDGNKESGHLANERYVQEIIQTLSAAAGQTADDSHAETTRAINRNAEIAGRTPSIEINEEKLKRELWALAGMELQTYDRFRQELQRLSTEPDENAETAAPEAVAQNDDAKEKIRKKLKLPCPTGDASKDFKAIQSVIKKHIEGKEDRMYEAIMSLASGKKDNDAKKAIAEYLNTLKPEIVLSDKLRIILEWLGLADILPSQEEIENPKLIGGNQPTEQEDQTPEAAAPTPAAAPAAGAPATERPATPITVAAGATIITGSGGGGGGGGGGVRPTTPTDVAGYTDRRTEHAAALLRGATPKVGGGGGVASPESPPKTDADKGELDPLFEEAKNVIIESGQTDTSFLMRRLRIGYVRAATIMGELENAGIIGPFVIGKPREILTGRTAGAPRTDEKTAGATKTVIDDDEGVDVDFTTDAPHAPLVADAAKKDEIAPEVQRIMDDLDKLLKTDDLHPDFTDSLTFPIYRSEDLYQLIRNTTQALEIFFREQLRLSDNKFHHYQKRFADIKQSIIKSCDAVLREMEKDTTLLSNKLSDELERILKNTDIANQLDKLKLGDKKPHKHLAGMIQEDIECAITPITDTDGLFFIIGRALRNSLKESDYAPKQIISDNFLAAIKGSDYTLTIIDSLARNINDKREWEDIKKSFTF